MIDIQIIQQAFDKVQPKGMPSDNPNWEVLFNFYNEHHERKLSLGCFPCYVKVYMWTRDKLKELNAKHA